MKILIIFFLIICLIPVAGATTIPLSNGSLGMEVDVTGWTISKPISLNNGSIGMDVNVTGWTISKPISLSGSSYGMDVNVTGWTVPAPPEDESEETSGNINWKKKQLIVLEEI